jgi:hypothetical protein
VVLNRKISPMQKITQNITSNNERLYVYWDTIYECIKSFNKQWIYNEDFFIDYADANFSSDSRRPAEHNVFGTIFIQKRSYYQNAFKT